MFKRRRPIEGKPLVLPEVTEPIEALLVDECRRLRIDPGRLDPVTRAQYEKRLQTLRDNPDFAEMAELVSELKELTDSTSLRSELSALHEPDDRPAPRRSSRRTDADTAALRSELSALHDDED